MNISASYNWIKEYVKTTISPEEFARRMSEAGMGVERIHQIGENLDKIVVATISDLRPHPGADRLRIAVVAVGKELIEVVCGGSNLSVGMKVAFAHVDARVRWHGQGDLIELAPAEIRGVKSFGMICAASEIGLGEWFVSREEKEILDLSWLDVPNGTPLKKALGLDDIVFDIEVTTNRPDAFSIIGLAREAATILKSPFLYREQKKNKKNKVTLPFSLSVAEKKLCPRIEAVVVDNVHIGPSPWWLQQRLLMSGIRPISNIVDITNYVMLETGQPMHAFDYDTLRGNKIIVRLAKTGEKIRALDGKDYTLTDEMLVLADAEWPADIAGVMGGETTSVTAKTKRVVLTVANFDAVSIRRTSRKLSLQSDASLLYEKGLSTEATTAALARSAALAEEIAGGHLASKALDVRAHVYKPSSYVFVPEDAEKLIGVSVSTKEMARILTALGFILKKKGKNFSVTVPWWRDHDIEDSRDLTEEIARIVGYHTLPSELPPGVPPLRALDIELALEDRLKTILVDVGATELYTYSFITEEMLSWVNVPGAAAVRLANPLSSDFAVMRTSLIPSMLATIRDNQVERPEGLYFEISRVYLSGGKGLPEEPLHLLLACVGGSPAGEQFFRVKGIFEHLARTMNIDVSFDESEHKDLSVWHPGRSTHLVFAGGEGMLGEIHPDLCAKIGLDRRVAMALIPISALHRGMQSRSYSPLPTFPPVKRDISFVIDQKKKYAEIVETVRSASSFLLDIALFDIYQGKGVPEGKKSMAFHLVFGAADRTLSSEEADTAMRSVINKIETLGAVVRQ